MNTMNITEEVLSKCDSARLFQLMVECRLPISQAFAWHLVEDKGYSLIEAGKLLGVSNIAVSDARIKARKKMDKK